MPGELNIAPLNLSVGRFLFLLVSLLLVMAVQPFINERVTADVLMNLFVPLVLLSGVYAVSERRSTCIAGAVLVVPAVACQWASILLEMPVLPLVTNTLDAAFLLFVMAVILGHLFRTREVTADTIFGSICAYLLLGFVWAFVYAILEMVMPGSFSVSEGSGSRFSEFYYYSFVTLTTLGYGDVVPLTPEARSFAVLEAAMGQIYIAVLVARLVGLHVSRDSVPKERNC